jgi:hypothetical protein
MSLKTLAESDLASTIENDGDPIKYWTGIENPVCHTVSGIVNRISSHKDPQTNLHVTLKRFAVTVRISTLHEPIIDGTRVEVHDITGQKVDGYAVNCSPDLALGFLNFQVEETKSVSKIPGNRGLA